MNMSVVIIGLGAAARNIHIPACSQVRDLEIIGAIDPQVQSSSYPFPIYPDIEAAFMEIQPGAAIIATPTDSHYRLCMAMLERGCHVICEKPFTETLSQAVEIVELAEKKGLSVVVNNEFRFMESHQAAKQKIGHQDFGDLRFLEMSQTFFMTEETEKGWRGEDPQRTCKEFGIHALDLCRFFFNEEPIMLNARMPLSGRSSGPDYLNLIDLEFSADRFAHITLDRLSRGRHRYLDIRLDGEHACVETGLGGELSLTMGIAPSTRMPSLEFDFSWGGSAYLWRGEKRRKLASEPKNIFAHATANLLRDWIARLENNTESGCSARNNIGTLLLLSAAYESAKTKRPILLQEYFEQVVKNQG